MKKGFTLIELLVVVAIIGILAATVLVNLNRARLDARDAKRQEDLYSLTSVLELYNDKYGFYPKFEGAESKSVGKGYGANFSNMFDNLREEDYVSGVVFEDPNPSDTRYYRYKSKGEGKSFHLEAIKEKDGSTIDFGDITITFP